MRTLLICHDGALLDEEGLARWLGSFSELAGIVVLRETRQRSWRRVRREIARVGLMRFVDVAAFRVYYKLCLQRRDAAWQKQALEKLRQAYGPALGAPVLHTSSPNSPEAEAFIRDAAPDLVVARCKTLLKDRIFSLARQGTFVMHPGICPEYRNAHGCFWALASNDLDNVGMTLLRIDRGVDTGPVFGYYRCAYDEAQESHVVIQHRVVLDNLPVLQKTLVDISNGTAVPLTTTGRKSAAWGQPWLTSYLRWKRRARLRKKQQQARSVQSGLSP